VIGDEILSADQGQEHRLHRRVPDQYRDRPEEVRVVADEEADIIAALNALRNAIPTCSPPAASGRPMTTSRRQRRKSLRRRHRPPPGSGGALQGALDRAGSERAPAAHARVPDGAELIQSATILAPGFKLATSS